MFLFLVLLWNFLLVGVSHGSLTSYTYNSNWNRATKTTAAGTESYTWDYENRLTALTKPGVGSYSYKYDHRARRVTRDESLAGGLKTFLSFSGGSSVQERSAAGVLITELIRGSDWGGGVGGFFYSIRSGLRSYNAYNSRGDVVSTSADNGSATWQASYQALGKRTAENGTNAEHQRANTKDEDPTGLLNEGHRYRDLDSGEFISRDPMGFIDGPNVYAYVRQNPWTMFDPEGLASADEKKWQGIAADENRNFAVRIGSSLMAAAEALNPFRSDSSLRDGGRQLQTGLAEGREKMKQAPPGIREVGQFAMGVGSAGTFILSGPAGVGEMGDSVQQ